MIRVLTGHICRSQCFKPHINTNVLQLHLKMGKMKHTKNKILYILYTLVKIDIVLNIDKRHGLGAHTRTCK